MEDAPENQDVAEVSSSCPNPTDQGVLVKYIVPGFMELSNRIMLPDPSKKKANIPDHEFQWFHTGMIKLITDSRHEQYTSSDFTFCSNAVLGPMVKRYLEQVEELRQLVYGYKASIQPTTPCTVVLHPLSVREIRKHELMTAKIRALMSPQGAATMATSNNMNLISERSPQMEEASCYDGAITNQGAMEENCDASKLNKEMQTDDACTPPLSEPMEEPILNNSVKIEGDRVITIITIEDDVSWAPALAVPDENEQGQLNTDKENVCDWLGHLENKIKRKTLVAFRGLRARGSHKILQPQLMAANQEASAAANHYEVETENFNPSFLDLGSNPIPEEADIKPDLQRLALEAGLLGVQVHIVVRDGLPVGGNAEGKDQGIELGIPETETASMEDPRENASRIEFPPETELLRDRYFPEGPPNIWNFDDKENQSALELAKEKTKNDAGIMMLNIINANNKKMTAFFVNEMKKVSPPDLKGATAWCRQMEPKVKEQCRREAQLNFCAIKQSIVTSTNELQLKKCQKSISHLELYDDLVEKKLIPKPIDCHKNFIGLLHNLEKQTLCLDIPASKENVKLPKAPDWDEKQKLEVGYKILLGSSINLDESELMIRANGDIVDRPQENDCLASTSAIQTLGGNLAVTDLSEMNVVATGNDSPHLNHFEETMETVETCSPASVETSQHQMVENSKDDDFEFCTPVGTLDSASNNRVSAPLKIFQSDFQSFNTPGPKNYENTPKGRGEKRKLFYEQDDDDEFQDFTL